MDKLVVMIVYQLDILFVDQLITIDVDLLDILAMNQLIILGVNQLAIIIISIGEKWNVNINLYYDMFILKVTILLVHMNVKNLLSNYVE